MDSSWFSTFSCQSKNKYQAQVFCSKLQQYLPYLNTCLQKSKLTKLLFKMTKNGLKNNPWNKNTIQPDISIKKDQQKSRFKHVPKW